MIKLTNPGSPFQFARLDGPERYNLQNMLLVETTNFPTEVELLEHIATVYSDRSYSYWNAAIKGLQSSYSGDARFAGMDDANLLEFGKRIATAIGFKYEVTGVRVIRFTDAGGFPCLRADLTYGGVRKHPRWRADSHKSQYLQPEYLQPDEEF